MVGGRKVAGGGGYIAFSWFEGDAPS